MTGHFVRISAPLVAISLFCLGPAWADPVDDGLAAYARGDYVAALQLLGPAAEQGDARAETGIGTMLGAGNGVPQNFVEARKWYRHGGGSRLCAGAVQSGPALPPRAGRAAR